MSKGWIKLHRKILSNLDLFKGSSTFPVWCYLLLKADKNGELKTGLISISKFLKIKKGTVYIALIRLENMGMIKREPKANLTIIKIVNWQAYQHDETPKSYITKPKARIKKPSAITVKPDQKLVDKMILTFETGLDIKLKNIPSQERACRSIIKRLGADKAMDAVTASIACHDKKYAPSISSLVSLDNKLNDLIIYYRKENNSKNNFKIGKV